MAGLDWSYWYVFPVAVLVATLANSSGFSGSVLFQPFFNLVLQLPVAQSIANGVATETVGMSSGGVRYLFMRQVDLRAWLTVVLPVGGGVVIGLFLFLRLPGDWLRLVVGLVVGTIAIYKLVEVVGRVKGIRASADRSALRRRFWVSAVAGSFSATTGTGVAEIHQPLLERRGGLETRRANATAIAIEAAACWCITGANLSWGNLRPEILVFSTTGVLLGAQLGAWSSQYLPVRPLKLIFAVAVLGIAVVYVVTFISRLQ